MRKCLTSFSRIVECGAVQKCVIFCVPRSCSFYSYLKHSQDERREVYGGHETGKKGDCAVSIHTCRAACHLHHPGTCLASQALSFEAAQSLLALLEQRARVHLLSFTSPGLAALLRSDGFFSGAVCFVRRTLARSAFRGCSIGFKRCKTLKCVN